MNIFVIDCPGRTNKGTAETGDTVFKNIHPGLAGLSIKRETFGRADIQAKLTAATGFVINGHRKHLNSSGVRG